MWALFPWLGSYAFLALERFLKIRCKKRLGLKGLNSSRPYYMQFTMTVTEEEFYQITAQEAEEEFEPMELLFPKEVPVFEKYDEYVPAELIRKGFALGVLDMANGLLTCMENLEKNRSKVSQEATRVKKLENTLNVQYHKSIAELFESDDFKKILKYREIYSHMNHASDKGDVSADILLDIIVKL